MSELALLRLDRYWKKRERRMMTMTSAMVTAKTMLAMMMMTITSAMVTAKTMIAMTIPQTAKL